MSNYTLPFVWFPEDGVWKQCTNGPESEHSPQPTQEAVHEYFKTLPQQFRDEHRVRFDEYGNDGWNLNVPERTLNPWIEKRFNREIYEQKYGLVVKVYDEKEFWVEFPWGETSRKLSGHVGFKITTAAEPEKLKMGTLVLVTLKKDSTIIVDVCPPTS